MSRLRSFLPREWPTWGLAFIIYGGWLLLILFWTMLPWPVLLVAGAWLIAWHMSLQHEVIHGHPSSNRLVNEALGFLPLSLWLPYAPYAESHRKHHREPHLTQPEEDPESFYFSAEDWASKGPLTQAIYRFNLTFLGRLLIGPALGMVRFVADEMRQVYAGVNGRRRIWAVHAVVVTGLIALLVTFGVPLWQYLVLAIYPGYALALIRSFAEHKAEAELAERTAIVEKTPVFGLLFLYNNLHVVHHRWPALPWYQIPQVYRQKRQVLIRENGGLVYQGYRDVARRYFLTPHHKPDLR